MSADKVGVPAFLSIKSITLSHDHKTMFVRVATDWYWFTFEGPYDQAQYHEIEDPNNETTVFEIEFNEMKRTGYGRLDGSIRAVRS